MKQINMCFQEGYTAGGKAKLDIHDILIKRGIESLDCKCIESDNLIVKVVNEIHKALFLISLIFRYEKVFLVQHPFSHLRIVNRILTYVAHKKSIIVIIHDLDGLRFQNRKKIEVESALLCTSKYIISHNSKMSKYIEKEMNVPKDKLIDLRMFDYLYKGEENNITKKKHDIGEKLTICYAGNLEPEKAPFIYEFCKHNICCNINLYGINYNGQSEGDITYKGSFPSHELIDLIEGDYGLVWDGSWDSNDEDDIVKNYTKYNNPHKLSLYMACGLPVIVWKKSAIASFVIENNIGFAIESLDDIKKIKVNADEYISHVHNVMIIQKQVRTGYYTNRAIDTIVERG